MKARVMILISIMIGLAVPLLNSHLTHVELEKSEREFLESCARREFRPPGCQHYTAEERAQTHDDSADVFVISWLDAAVVLVVILVFAAWFTLTCKTRMERHDSRLEMEKFSRRHESGAYFPREASIHDAHEID